LLLLGDESLKVCDSNKLAIACSNKQELSLGTCLATHAKMR